MRRALVIAASTAWVLASASAALADELDDLFERAAQAEFSGTKFVHCETGEGVVGEIADIKQAGGVAVIRARTADTEVIARKGEYTDRAGEYSKVATVSVANAGDRESHYRVDVVGVRRELGRRVTVVQLFGGETLRAEITFDAATGAVLRSVTYNGDGTTYCVSEFIAFVAGAPEMELQDMEAAERTEMVAYEDRVDEGRLPPQAGGFARTDVYEGSSRTVVAYYSDGVFSFTLVAAEGAIVIPELENVALVTIDGHEYQRQFFPGQAVFVWEAPHGGYAMVADAPLDMQEAVLGDLPRPGRQFFLARWWSALTGR